MRPSSPIASLVMEISRPTLSIEAEKLYVYCRFFLFVLNMVVIIIEGVYEVIHSSFWKITVLVIILASCFSMWPQVIGFTIFMAMSMVVVALIEVLTVFLGGVMGSVAGMLTA
jgi:hypothetical protein